MDVAVVGSGAAGLMAAISCARQKEGGPSARVPLSIVCFDSKPKIGAKILMSGGTRCNVTNLRVTENDFSGGPKHTIRHALAAFSPERTVEFFRELGVELVVEEPLGKYFPSTHSARTVLDALEKERERLGIELRAGVKIDALAKDAQGFRLTGAGLDERAARVILATGGLSHPDTGSDGTGLSIARTLGHLIVPLVAALTPFTADDADWKGLSGVALPDVALSLYIEEKKTAESRGNFLFTHFGFSGSSCLDLSRHFTRAAAANLKPRVQADLLPAQNAAALKAALERFIEKSPARSILSFLSEQLGLPARFAGTLLLKEKLTGGRAAQFSAEKRTQLLRLLKHYPLPVTGVYGFKKAEVTAGGVDLREITVSTMQSKRVPGLYFAGEILDADGRIGGFNFQWSWATGWAAGQAAAKSL